MSDISKQEGPWAYATQNMATTPAERETWSCAIGGLIAAMIAAGMAGYVMSQMASVPVLFKAALVIVVFAVVGQMARLHCGKRAAAVAAPEPTPAPAPRPAARPKPVAAPKAEAKPAPKPKPAPEPGPVEAAAEEVGTRPKALDAPRDGGADNLKKIKGVGPALEKLCNKLGFYHFDQIAAWTADEIAWVDTNLEGFKGRVTRDDWVSQAKILAAGGETEFSARKS